MNLNIRTCLILIAATGPLLGAGIGLIGFRGVQTLGRSNDSIAKSAQSLRNHMEADMMHDALRADVLAALAAENEEALNEVDKDLAEHSDLFRKGMSENKALAVSEELTAEVAKIEPSVNKYIDDAKTMVGLARKDRAEAVKQFPSFAEQFHALEGMMEKVSDVVEDHVKKTKEGADEARSAAATTMIWGWVLATAAMLAVGLTLSARISRRLRQVTERMARIAEGEGELKSRVINIQGDDEIAVLSRSFNAFAARIHDVVGEVSKMIDGVIEHSDSIVSSMDQATASIQKQAGAAEEIASAVEELSSSVASVNESSKNATGAASQSGSTARDGQTVVAKSIDNMNAINGVVTDSAKRVNELGRCTEEIGQIMTVIRDIADQTNLLALNAAIEAARAGEHGRGFAVVADEVRKLADRTATATRQVSESIGRVQTETASAIQSMKKGAEQVREGVSLVGTAGESLGRIVTTSAQTAEMIASIASMVAEQRTATESVARQATDIRDATLEAKNLTESSRQSAGVLQEQSTSLRESVRSFMMDRSKGRA